VAGERAPGRGHGGGTQPRGGVSERCRRSRRPGRRPSAAAAAARATVERLEVDRADYELKAPRDGRIQYRVAQPGEVVASGGRVLDMVDLADVTMSFFLPATTAGRVALGADVRLVLDAAPGYAVPARVSFVADVAQFTPKSVETQSEREKLMFKIKARIDPELLRQHLKQVKSGLPGVAWVRLDPAAPWPPELAALKSP
jgi:HlyD family secretion protein